MPTHIQEGSTAGGDLGGTYPDPTVDNIFLKLDQTTPQTVVNGLPEFSAGIRAKDITSYYNDDDVIIWNYNKTTRHFMFDTEVGWLGIGMGTDTYIPLAPIFIRSIGSDDAIIEQVRLLSDGAGDAGSKITFYNNNNGLQASIFNRGSSILAIATGNSDVEAFSVSSSGITIGSGVAATDYTLTFNGETNDGVLTWMEDEDYFQFGDDVTFVGDNVGLPYGSCWGNEIAWSQENAAQNTWYVISDTDMSDGQLNLVTHDGSGKLTVTKGGRYLVNYSWVGDCNGVGKHIQIGIAVSGTVGNDGMSHFYTATAAEEFTASGTAILDLAASAYVEVAMRTTDTGTPTLQTDHLNLSLVMVGGT